MKSYNILTMMALFFASLGICSDDVFDYDMAWKRVEAALSKGLPKTALEEINVIYEAASRDHNVNQQLRATISSVTLVLDTEELGLEAVVRDLDDKISRASSPASEILHSMTAELFEQYYRSQYYLISQRTDLADYDTGDMRTWAPNNFRAYIADHYLRSLSGDLRKFKTEDYKDLLINADRSDIDMRPTLHDLLVDRALGYFSGQEYQMVTSSFTFQLDDLSYYQGVDRFVDLDITTGDQDSKLYRAVRLFQDQLAYLKDKGNIRLLAEYDLKRLEFVHLNAQLSGKQEAFEASLQSAGNTYPKEERGRFLIRLAQEYMNQLRYDDAVALLDSIDTDTASDEVNGQRSNFLAVIRQQSISLMMESVLPASQGFLAQVRSRNVDQLFFKIVEMQSNDAARIFSLRRPEQLAAFEDLPVIKSWETAGVKDGYKETIYEEAIDGLSYGSYAIICSNNKDFSGTDGAYQYALFQVSDLAYTTYKTLDGSKLSVRDRTTGAPVADVTVEVRIQEYNRTTRKNDIKTIRTDKTDAQGWIYLGNKELNGVTYRLSKGADLLSLEEFDYSYKISERTYDEKRTEILMDRAIYRPGQIAHYKILSMKIDDNGVPSINPNQKVYLALRDANYQVVEEWDVLTNDFGSASGHVILPTGRLTGSYTLVADEQSQPFRVEEYKRPKFEVEFEPIKGPYALGDEVKVSGKAAALSGAPSSNAKVSYTVMRNAYVSWWSWYRRVPTRSEIITQGESMTDEAGRFSIDFTTSSDPDTKASDNPTYTYQVTANVTDASGETRSSETSIAVSLMPYLYAIDLSEHVDRSRLKAVDIKALTVESAPVASTATLKITALISPSQWQKKRLWGPPNRQIIDKNKFEDKVDRISYLPQSVLAEYPEGAVILSKTIDIGTEGLRMDLAQYVTAGEAYKVEVISKDQYKGRPISVTHYMAVSDHQTAVYHVSNLIYLHPSADQAEVGNTYRLKIGTPDDKLHVYYTILRDQKIVKEGIVNAENQYTISYTPTQLDKGGISIQMDYVKHNTSGQVWRQIPIPWEDKQLKVELLTIRDKVLPGSEEEWKIKISGQEASATMTELLATMYDASLDQFVSHDFSFDPYARHDGRLPSQYFGFGLGRSGGLNYQWNTISRAEVNPRVIPVLKGIQYGYSMYGSFRGHVMGTRSMAKRSRPASPEMIDGVMVMADAESAQSDAAASAQNERLEEEPEMDGTPTNVRNKVSAPIRKNLNESVFFYPHLVTDREGNIILKFTMNEALTTWKLLTFAHDKQLRYGMSSHEVKTQKDVMILPNAPRFLREGDKVIFPATVSNLSNEEVSAVAKIDIRDAATDAPLNDVFRVERSAQDMTIAPGTSARVDWQLNVPTDFKRPVKYTVFVKAGDHTDGEENVLPVLTNQVLVTETEVISVKQKETKNIQFDALKKSSSTAVPHRYTLEYTSNPVWYAVQALPYMMEYPHQCTEQIFNKLYANQMASHIANASPMIRSVFERWKIADADALLSNLEKNEELKSALLEESPWVRQAQSETEQKKRLALLFDLNTMAAELDAALSLLTERQMSNGAFPWFAGGRENVYITQNVIEGIVHLQHLGIIEKEDARFASIVNRAMVFLDEMLKKRYEQVLERIQKYGGDIDADHLDYLSIHYLYIQSFMGTRAVGSGADQAYRYYMGQAERYWLGKGLYSEAMIGLAMRRDGRKVVADISKSLAERSFYSDELGRYWNIGSGFYWHELPIESHAMLIEFFAEVGAEELSVEDMKIWLLKNKQTNHWKTTKATAAAIYALLIQGEEGGMVSWIEDESQAVISVGGRILDIPDGDVEAGTGYIKRSWSGDEISPDLGSIKIQSKGESISWGAAYYQYFEDMDKVDDFADTPLRLTKKLFVEKMTDKGPQLTEVDQSTINTGDRIIVRIEVRVDRNMNYVHLKDLRSSGFEPEHVMSGYRYQGGLGYYESTRDLASHFFFSELPKGTYVIEYPMRAVHKGDFASGVATLQCMYAPEYTSHSNGDRVQVY